jgi:hypothetical protein
VANYVDYDYGTSEEGIEIADDNAQLTAEDYMDY